MKKRRFDRFKDPAEMEEWEREELARLIRRERKYIGEHVTPTLLKIIEDRFMLHLTCFQLRPDGSFDPLDAMRRDANREVVLFLRDEITKYKQENEDND